MGDFSESIPIFYAVNDRYVPYLAVSMSSLIAHTDPQNNYEIYILQQHLSKDHQIALQKLTTHNVKIHLISMGKRLARLQSEHNTLRGDYETLTIYYRLFISAMFPEYQRAIYLDADTVLLTDIAELYRVNLHNNILGAVPDAFARRYHDTVNYVNCYLGLDMDHYFNSGVLLMDLQKLRDYRFIEEFSHLLSRYHFDVLAADQDYLNTICQGSIYRLPVQWNASPTVDGRNTVEHPKLVHYAFFDKPWLHRHVSYENVFWQAAASTKFDHQLKDQCQSDGENRQNREQQVIDGLLGHARQLINTTPSLASVFRSGEEQPLCLNQAHKPLRIFTMRSKGKTSMQKSNRMMPN